MKKIILLSIVGIALLSCAKKSFTCRCVGYTGLQQTEQSIEVKAKDYNDADEQCALHEIKELSKNPYISCQIK